MCIILLENIVLGQTMLTCFVVISIITKFSVCVVCDMCNPSE